MKTYKKPEDIELRKKLTPLQYEVTQKDATEKPFHNEYWDNKKAGIYIDITSGEPLFSSLDKFDSGTGWPSFTKPLVSENVTEKKDRKFFMVRTEVRSKFGNSHLGHVFDDGPKPTGLRYCMNSAAMRFIPVENLEKEGYGEFLQIFENQKAAATTHAEITTLAGGCFWGVEELIRKQPGVLKTEVGYSGGAVENPTYELVKKGDTGHAEAIQIEFDPTQTNFEKLLRYFYTIHDPTTQNQQGNDKGSQYRSVIFIHNSEQARIANKVIEEVNASGVWKKPIVTEVVPFRKFYSAEAYHQDYLQKNPGGYTCHYERKF